MPTGYTADIAKGISFKEFALGCARAFGALVTMRDESRDVPIPDEIQPSTYHKEALEDIREEMQNFFKKGDKELRETYEEDLRSYLENTKRYSEEKAELKEKYEKILAEAEAYQPPTEEHTGFKDFMVSQIKESIDWDCTMYKREPFPEFQQWYDRKIEDFQWDLDYYAKRWKEEQERAAERTKWIQDLKKSLQ